MVALAPVPGERLCEIPTLLTSVDFLVGVFQPHLREVDAAMVSVTAFVASAETSLKIEKVHGFGR